MTDAINITEARRETAESTKCCLLDLPGELRNEIYHFAKEDEPVTYCSSRLTNQSEEELAGYGVKKTEPSFLGLMHACRQLRQEYSPIYAIDTRIHVCAVDLDEYLGRGLPLLARGTDGNIMGTLFVDCRSMKIGRRLFSEDEPDVDLVPLLALCRHNPGLRVRGGLHGCQCSDCRSDWDEVKFDMHYLFELAQNSALGQALVASIVSFHLIETKYLTIVMKQEIFEEWVIVRRDQYGEEWFTLVKTGFEFSSMTKIYSTSSIDKLWNVESGLRTCMNREAMDDMPES